MEPRFQAAVAAVRAGDLEQFEAALKADPALATARSAQSHPTLLQCVALDGKGKPSIIEMARILVDAGARIDGPLVAAASIDNAPVAELLLDRGAAIDGNDRWSPIEEALYWESRATLALLLKRGARVRNLRIAAGLGRTDLIAGFFDASGALKPTAGTIEWPFGSLEQIERSNHDARTKHALANRIRAWRQDRQGIVDNAFVYACMHGHIGAAELLLEKGAAIDAIPGGFDFAGTGLHYAAHNGHRAMVEFLLERGADPSIKDTKVNSDAAGWAEHAGHTEIAELLRRGAPKKKN